MAQLVYLDSWMLVLDKKAGEAVQGRRPEQKALLRSWRQTLGEGDLQPAHRIDQPVPGLVVLARGTESFTALQAAFRGGRVGRSYLAVVSAAPAKPAGTLEDWISEDRGRNRSRIHPAADAPKNARAARMSYRVVGATDHHHVLLVELATGRHHQIRAQLAHHGCPVVGDTKYGARRPLRDGGIALLAWRLAIPHPAVPGVIRLQAAFPEGAMWRAVRELAGAQPLAAANAAG